MTSTGDDAFMFVYVVHFFLFQADKDVPLKTVKQVMYTAARAGYNDFKFAVIRQ